MTKKQISVPHGVLKDEMTDTQQDMLSTNAESQSISVTLASTAPQNQSSQAIPNSLGNPHLMHAKIISAFAAKLGALVEWRKVSLRDGREGYALFFDTDKWLVDPLTKELTPLGE